MNTAPRTAPQIAPQNIESKSASLRQPQYAWEMSLEQFRQTYFPELCEGQDSATEQCGNAGPCDAPNRRKAA